MLGRRPRRGCARPSVATWLSSDSETSTVGPGLDLKSREIATIAALTALGTAAPQLRAHIHAALNVVALKKKSSKSSSKWLYMPGFPATINGMQAAQEVFMERTGRNEFLLICSQYQEVSR